MQIVFDINLKDVGDSLHQATNMHPFIDGMATSQPPLFLFKYYKIKPHQIVI